MQVDLERVIMVTHQVVIWSTPIMVVLLLVTEVRDTIKVLHLTSVLIVLHLVLIPMTKETFGPLSTIISRSMDLIRNHLFLKLSMVQEKVSLPENQMSWDLIKVTMITSTLNLRVVDMLAESMI